MLCFGFQIEAIKELVKCNPKGRFWLKADGTDVKAALQESVRREWNGDVDLLDGKLQDIRREYEARISSCEIISKANDISTEDLVAAFTALIAALEEDIIFLDDGLQKAVESFRSKFNNPSTPVETLKSLNWDIVEFQTLLEQASFFKEQISISIAELTSSRLQAPAAPNWRLWIKQPPAICSSCGTSSRKSEFVQHTSLFSWWLMSGATANLMPFPSSMCPIKGLETRK